MHLGSFHSQLAFVHTVLDKFDPARWLLLHLQPQFRFKSQYSTSFSTMFIMHTFSYTGLWRYFLLPSFPTLNLRHYPAPEFGTNPMAYCRNIRLLPMHSLTLHIFLHRILMKRKPSWMTCCNTIFRSPTNMLVHHHPMLFQILRSFRQRHPHLRSVNRRPKLLPRPLTKRRRTERKSPSRSPSPSTTWTSEEKQKLRTLKSDERSRFSWRVISTKMGKTEADVRSMWNQIKDTFG